MFGPGDQTVSYVFTGCIAWRDCKFECRGGAEPGQQDREIAGINNGRAWHRIYTPSARHIALGEQSRAGLYAQGKTNGQWALRVIQRQIAR